MSFSISPGLSLCPRVFQFQQRQRTCVSQLRLCTRWLHTFHFLDLFLTFLTHMRLQLLQEVFADSPQAGLGTISIMSNHVFMVTPWPSSLQFVTTQHCHEWCCVSVSPLDCGLLGLNLSLPQHPLQFTQLPALTKYVSKECIMNFLSLENRAALVAQEFLPKISLVFVTT